MELRNGGDAPSWHVWETANDMSKRVKPLRNNGGPRLMTLDASNEDLVRERNRSNGKDSKPTTSAINGGTSK